MGEPMTGPSLAEVLFEADRAASAAEAALGDLRAGIEALADKWEAQAVTLENPVGRWHVPIRDAYLAVRELLENPPNRLDG